MSVSTSSPASRPLRIAVYHDLPSGGAKRTLLELVRRLAGRHAIDVFTLGWADHGFADVRPHAARHEVLPFSPLRSLDSPFGRANQLLRMADLWRLDRVARTVAHSIDGGSYDVAFVHPCQREQAPSVLRHLRRTPSVYFCQEPLRLLYEVAPARPYDDEAIGRRRVLNRLDPLPALYRRRLRATDRRNVRAPGRVLVSSRFMAEAIGRIYGLEPLVSRLGVDGRVFAPSGVERGEFVLSVGSLTPLKGFDFVVEALARLPERARPPLVIASNFQNPAERRYLEDLAGRRGVRLDLRGNVSEADLVRLYNSARLVAYAPVREPFGLVALEAMACAAPLVAVAEGGVVESVVDGLTGALAPRDPHAFARAMLAVLESPEVARRYGESGRDHVLASWTWEGAVDEIERHLAACAGESVRPDAARLPLPPISGAVAARR